MRDRKTLILDMTGEQPSVGILGPAAGELMMVEEFAPDLRVALCSIEGQIHAFAGTQSRRIPGGVRPLVFDHLHACLPRIEDEELQSLIVAAVWRDLCEGWSERRLIGSDGCVNAYAIVRNQPVAALERFRSACATEERIRLVAFPNEAASLVLGAVKSGAIEGAVATDSSMATPVCLIVAYSDRHVEVCSFEHMIVDKTGHRIFIRDFFRTGSADLGGELLNRHGFDDSRLAVLFESPSLSERSQKSLLEAVNRASWKTVRSPRPLVDLRALKIRGAAHLVCNTQGENGGPVEYRFETAFNIGVCAEGERFQPVLTQGELRGAVRYPVTSSGTFRLHPKPPGDIAIRACFGYSNRVEESTTIGQLTITRSDIDELFRRKQGAFSVQVMLESAGKGVFSLEILPSGRSIGAQTFTLPGLMA